MKRMLFCFILAFRISVQNSDTFRVHGHVLGGDCYFCTDHDTFSPCVSKKQVFELLDSMNDRQNRGPNFTVYRFGVEICPADQKNPKGTK